MSNAALAKAAAVHARPARLPPLWPLLAAILAGELLLQWFPITGVVLMMLAAPAWSIVLVNAVLIAMALDAWRGAMPRWFIGVPAAVYLLNLIAAGVSYYDYLALQGELARQNAPQSVAFDPTRETLALGSDGADSLVLNYRIPVVFVANPNAKPASYLSYRVLPRARCDEIDGANGFGPVQVLGAATMGKSYANVCQLRMFEDPALPVVRFTQHIQTGQSPDGLIKYATTTYQATAPDGRVAVHLVGVAQVLPPIPMPVIGCALNDAANRWECIADLFRWPVSFGHAAGDDRFSNAATVAGLLRLQPRSVSVLRPAQGMFGAEELQLDPREFDPASMDQAAAIADRLSSARTEEALAELPVYLSDPQTPVGPDFARVVARHADRAAPWAEAIAAKFDAATPEKQSSIGYQLGTILAALPPEAFARVGPLALQAAQRQRDDTPMATTLITRLGDLAPASTPYLLQLLDSHDRMAADAALMGFCRAGQAAEAQGPALAADLARNRFANRPAAFLALRRMGRYDLAQQVAGPPDGRLQAMVVGDAAAVTPASPRTVCRFGGRLSPDLPDVPWLR